MKEWNSDSRNEKMFIIIADDLFLKHVLVYK